ncbi:cytochrome P450 [Mycena sanguinolenta]|nr:cytochrome P450 [Mycena sanguinolenta]
MSSSPVQATVLLGVGYALVVAIRHFFGRSTLDKVPGPPSRSFLTGNLMQYFDPSGWAFQRDLEDNYGGVVRLHGLLGSSTLLVSDPVALHSILHKDSDMYEEPELANNVNIMLFGRAIFATMGEEHRQLRKMMMPAFSTANLRGMMPHFYDVAERVRDGLLVPQVAEGPQEVEMASVLTRTSLELIGQSGLGCSFDSLAVDSPKNEYAETIKNLMPLLGEFSHLFPLLPTVVKIGTPGFRRWLLDIVPWKSLHRLRDMTYLMENTAKEILQRKKAALQSGDFETKEHVGTGTDIMSILLRANLTADESSRLTDVQMLAQTTGIIFAAMDTTSSALCRIFHVLASHPEVQDKLRTEIVEASAGEENGHLTHDKVVELRYLDCVVRETLRLYPPVAPGVMRETVAPAILPLARPITATDGSNLTSVPVPKGTQIVIAIAKANSNPDIWGADAREFKPERWVNGRAESTDMKMPGVWGGTMTFLGGKRSCIGFKFSELEMKVSLCVLLRSFRFSLSAKDVKFQMSAAIIGPTVDGQTAMPLVVEKVTG